MPPVPANRAVVDCGVYVDGVRRPGLHDFRHARDYVQRTGEGFVWLGLHAPNAEQMTKVAEVFDMHPLIVEDMVQAHQRPKLELYDGTVFLVLRPMRYIDHDSISLANDIVHVGEIMVLAGPNFVITVRHGEHSGLASVRTHLEAHPQLLALGPAAVAHAVADHVVDGYTTVVSDIEPDVDELEERVFASSTADLEIDVVYMFKREILELRRAVVPLSAPLSWLSGNNRVTGVPHGEPTGSFDHSEIKRQFRDVADHLTAAVELVHEYDERLSNLITATATKVGIQQNSDMRKISSWAAVAAVPTMVAGLYGMNFTFMPELQWRWSYPVLLASLALVCLGIWALLHKNRWL